MVSSCGIRESILAKDIYLQSIFTKKHAIRSFVEPLEMKIAEVKNKKKHRRVKLVKFLANVQRA